LKNKFCKIVTRSPLPFPPPPPQASSLSVCPSIRPACLQGWSPRPRSSTLLPRAWCQPYRGPHNHLGTGFPPHTTPPSFFARCGLKTTGFFQHKVEKEPPNWVTKPQQLAVGRDGG
jgi:hypothetical protein